MRPLLTALSAILILGGSVWAEDKLADPRIFDVAEGKETTLHEILPTLKEKSIVLVGEHHDQRSHHTAQLLIVESLHKSGLPVAVGLEMFRAENQGTLNSWISGHLSEQDFLRAYYSNWNLPWRLYRMIFSYAKRMKIPLVGLNVPRAITRHVAREGFQALSEKEKEELPNVECKVDREYMDFIKRAYGAHAHGTANFIYFCEAQLVWDTVMAINAIRYLEANPTFSMVLLAGTGHAWKKGIPEQIRKRSQLRHAVILPHVPGDIEPGGVTVGDTDYIMLDLDRTDTGD